MKSMELEKEGGGQPQQGGRGVAVAGGRGGRGRGARGRGWNNFSHGEHDDRMGGPDDGDQEYVRYLIIKSIANKSMLNIISEYLRQSSDISWGRPGEGRVEHQQWGRKERRGGERQDQRGGERQDHQVQIRSGAVRVQLQGGQRTVVDQVEGSEGPPADLRSKLSQRRGEGNRDLREDLNNRRAEEGEERPLSPRAEQRRAAAEERERLRNRARGGGSGGGGQHRGGRGGNNQHHQQTRGGQNHAGRQNGRDHDHHQPHQNGVHDHQHQQGKQSGGKQIPRPKKNTENFNPSHEAPPMR